MDAAAGCSAAPAFSMNDDGGGAPRYIIPMAAANSAAGAGGGSSTGVFMAPPPRSAKSSSASGASRVPTAAGGYSGSGGHGGGASRPVTSATTAVAGGGVGGGSAASYVVVALFEARGTREVGMAIVDLAAMHSISLLQLRDGASYANTLGTLELHAPLEIVLAKHQVNMFLQANTRVRGGLHCQDLLLLLLFSHSYDVRPRMRKATRAVQVDHALGQKVLEQWGSDASTSRATISAISKR